MNYKIGLIILFFIRISMAGVATEKIKTETYKDIISKSQLLMLQKDRLQAINLLLMSLQKEDSKSVAYSDLKKTLNRITHMFLNESVQADYELALSLDKTDRKAAADKMSEVLKAEPQNTQVIKSLIIMNLAQKKCSISQNLLENLLNINPHETQLPFLEVQSTVCLKNTNKYKELKKKYETLSHIPLEFWYINDNRIQLPVNERTSEFILSIDHFGSVNPEVLYFKATSDSVNEKDKNNLIKEYIKRCKAPRSGYIINNYLDPWICDNLSMVQDDEKNNKM